MDDVRIGNTIRAIRIRKHLRQSDVARRAGVRAEAISRIERGEGGRAQLDTLRSVATALGAHVDLRIRWQGADIDRVLNAAHADLHESVVRYLSTCDGWAWRPEVSFSVYGERGVIDILAWHAESRTLLIIELKTELVDPQELAATMGRRVRLARDIASTFGWEPRVVGSWVIATESSTNRRRRRRHSHLLATAFPADGRHMRRWLRKPQGSIAALSFWSDTRPGSVRRTISQTQRVRRQETGRREARLSVAGRFPGRGE